MAALAFTQISVYATHNLSLTPFDVKWIPDSAKFILLGENPNRTGKLSIFDITTQGLKNVSNLKTSSGLKCGTFGASLEGDIHLATGSFDGKLSIWDIENLKTPIFEVQAHENLINSIDGCGGLNIGYGAPEIVTAGKDGSVKIWDPRQNIPVSCIDPVDGIQSREAWACCFGNSYDDTNRCICAGYDNGDIKQLDLRMQKIVWETNVQNGVCSLEFDRKDIKQNKLLCTTLESSFQVFDMRTCHPKDGYSHLCINEHGSTIWKGHHLPSNREKWITCGGDGTLKVWKYSYPEKRVLNKRGVMGTVEEISQLKLSTQPVVSLDWNREKQGLAVCASLDQKISVLFANNL